ncbi:hypothetical protein Fcan01_26590, partial [Folsomia candida]
APSEIKDWLPYVTAAASGIFEIGKNIHAGYQFDRAVDSGKKCTGSVSTIMKVGAAAEMLALAVQFWRLREFTKLTGRATNLRDESREKLKQAVQLMGEAEKLIKGFESFYKVEGKKVNIWQMNKATRAIYTILDTIKDCIIGLEFRVGNQILQLKGTGIFLDSLSSIAFGGLSMVSSGLAMSMGNPVLGLVGLGVGLSRVFMGGIGIAAYDASLDLIKELEVELAKILKLGLEYKELKDKFEKLVDSIDTRDEDGDECVITVK